MQIIQGNIIDLIKKRKVDVVIHGCNCFCTMGAGIAAQLADNFPEIVEEDNKTEMVYPGDKLGNYSTVELSNGVIVINAYTQFKPGRDVNYDAIEKVFNKLGKILDDAEYSDLKIAFPKIGAGIAGGDWDIISKIIDNAFKNVRHSILVEYQPK